MRTRVRRGDTSEHLCDLWSSVTDSKLVQTTAESLQPFCANKIKASPRQDTLNRSIKGHEFEVRQALYKSHERHTAVISLERFWGPGIFYRE